MKKYAAEFLATFILIFCAAGSATVNEITGGTVSLVGCAIVSGLVVMAMIYAVGDISGAHLNPAVTIAFALNKNLAWKYVLPYITSQVLGTLPPDICYAIYSRLRFCWVPRSRPPASCNRSSSRSSLRLY
jgi:aquaporin Z